MDTSATALSGQRVRLRESKVLSCNVHSPVHDRGSFIPPPSLKEISSYRVQESLLVSDLLHVLVGLEGNYVRSRSGHNSWRSRIDGPDWKLATHLNETLKAVAREITVYGRYCRGLEAFIEAYERPRFGRVNHAFCHEIRRRLTAHHQLVANLRLQFCRDGRFSINDMARLVAVEAAPLARLHDIATEIHASTESRASGGQGPDPALWLARLDLPTDDNRPYAVCKGGAVLKIVQRRINTHAGDPTTRDVLVAVYEAIATPYVECLNHWLKQGELDDPFDEFFVRESPSANTSHSRFLIHYECVVDQLDRHDLLAQVLQTGDFLDVVRRCTGVASLHDIPEYDLLAAEAPVASVFSQDLPVKIARFHAVANRLLLRVLFQGYELPRILRDLHRLLFLSDASPASAFVSSAYHDLCRPPSRHTTARLQKAFNDATAFSAPLIAPLFCHGLILDSDNFYDTAEKVLSIEPIDARHLLSADLLLSVQQLLRKSLQRTTRPGSLADSADSAADTEATDPCINYIGISVNVPFPLSLAIGDSAVFKYKVLFKLHMAVIFATADIDRTWKELNLLSVWRYRFFDTAIKHQIKRCRLLNMRMKSVVNLLQEYMDYTVAEENFGTLEEVLVQAETALAEPMKHPQPAENVSSTNGFLKTTSRNNRLFDEKISALGAQTGSTNNDTKNQTGQFGGVKDAIGSYLDNMLRDSMVRSSGLLACVHHITTTLFRINRAMGALKKSLILMDNHQFEVFAQDYPEKFASADMSEQARTARLAAMSTTVTALWRAFSDAVSELQSHLGRASTNGNSLFAAFASRLGDS